MRNLFLGLAFCLTIGTSDVFSRMRLESEQTEDQDSDFFSGFSPSVAFSIGIPNFTKVKDYKRFFGKPNPYLTIDWSTAAEFFEHLGLGAGVEVGYYITNGKRAVRNEGVAPDSALNSETTTMSKEKVSLSIFSYQLYLSAKARLWIFEPTAWFGMEELRYLEKRTEEKDTSSSFYNRFWNSNYVVGTSFNILINGLDETSVHSVKILGYDKIYLAPFFEMTFPTGFKKTLISGQPTSAKGKNFPSLERQTLGVSFVFEG